jgi:hypothetical protein
LLQRKDKEQKHNRLRRRNKCDEKE